MCGRFTLHTPINDIISHFLIDELVGEWEPRYNVAPSQTVLSMIQHRNSRRAGPITWGLVPFWVKETKKWKPLINARSETITEKSSFNRLIHKKRMVLIADSFYEWKRVGSTKQPVRFMLKSEKPFALAALWDQQGSKGEGLTTTTILTTKANNLVSPIHDRMPVILQDNESIEKWINTKHYTFEEANSILKPLPEEFMKSYEVSALVNSPKHDSAECVAPINL